LLIKVLSATNRKITTNMHRRQPQ